MANSSVSQLDLEQLELAHRALDAEDFEAAQKILHPLLTKGIAEAQYLASTFSIGGETIEAFDRRSLRLVQLAAAQEHPEALYIVGVYHGVGEYLPRDQIKAAMLFEKAAAKGHLHCEYLHGTALIYGVHGIKKDVTLGLQFLHRAAEAGHEQALLILAEFHEKGSFGMAKDEVKARALRQRAQELADQF